MKTPTVSAARSIERSRPRIRLINNIAHRDQVVPIPQPNTMNGQRLVSAGIDVLRAAQFAPLQGKRVGLLTNQTGQARDGQTTIDLIHAATGVRLAALFSPEHGISGTLDAEVPSTRDEGVGVPIYSLYGSSARPGAAIPAGRRPTPAMLDGLDVMVIDLQDVGARFYTYMSTMAYVMEVAAEKGLPVMVLDRPNPINGLDVEGPVLERGLRGFTGYFPMPIRHGLTLGELAQLFNAENHIGADLTVVAMQGWRRALWFDQTGLPWINPSPNIQNLNAATLYPGVGALEATNISVGRGTDAPFEQIGAPWIDGVRLAAELNGRHLPGVSFYPVTFTPSFSRFAGQACRGVFILVTNRSAMKPVRLGIEVASTLVRLSGDTYDLDAGLQLLGSRDVIRQLRGGEDPETIANRWASDEAKWRTLREKHLIYK